MAKAIADEEDRSGKVAADRIPDEMRKGAFMKCTCFIFAGEASGDFLGSRLMQAMGDQYLFQGVGGPLMISAGLHPLLPFDRFGQMGFLSILRHVWQLKKDFHTLVESVLHQKPDLVLLVDFPGWNLRFSSALRKKGFTGRIVQYVCPSVWAHGRQRIQQMVDTLDLLLVLYPFEPPLFSHTPLQVQFVGHPLVEVTPPPLLHTEPKAPLIALFPGSREQEVVRHAPILVQVAALLQEQYPEVQFAISCLSESFQPRLEKIIKTHAPQMENRLEIVPSSQKELLLQTAALAIAKSGTVTLELFLHQIPTIAVYSLSFFDFMIAKYLLRLRLPFYCLVNLLADKELFPEYIGPHVSPTSIATATSALWQDPAIRKNISDNCSVLRDRLLSPLSINGIRLSPSATAAHYVEALF